MLLPKRQVCSPRSNLGRRRRCRGRYRRGRRREESAHYPRLHRHGRRCELRCASSAQVWINRSWTSLILFPGACHASRFPCRASTAPLRTPRAFRRLLQASRPACRPPSPSTGAAGGPRSQASRETLVLIEVDGEMFQDTVRFDEACQIEGHRGFQLLGKEDLWQLLN